MPCLKLQKASLSDTGSAFLTQRCLLQGLDYPLRSALLHLFGKSQVLKYRSNCNIYIYIASLKPHRKNRMVCLNSFAGAWAGAREGVVCLGEVGTCR